TAIGTAAHVASRRGLWFQDRTRLLASCVPKRVAATSHVRVSRLSDGPLPPEPRTTCRLVAGTAAKPQIKINCRTGHPGPPFRLLIVASPSRLILLQPDRSTGN